MRCLIIFASLVLAISAATDKDLWSEFKEKYGREYRNLKEEQKRFSIFQDNLRVIDTHNEKYQKGESTYYMGINKFTDMTPEEFKSILNYNKDTKPVVNATKAYQISGRDVPSSVNWVSQGVVAPIKDQSDCGSCWVFGAVAAVESLNALKTGNLVELSEQNVLDCSSVVNPCDGGWVQSVFEYIKDNGIQTESDYPYYAEQGTCVFDSSRSVLNIQGYTEVDHTEAALQDALANVGPVSLGVNANWYIYYAGGVFDESECDNSDMNHVVLGVGYGSDSGVDYWLIKNSWGTNWGESGYIKHVRNKNMQCGIGTEITYPIV